MAGLPANILSQKIKRETCIPSPLYLLRIVHWVSPEGATALSKAPKVPDLEAWKSDGETVDISNTSLDKHTSKSSIMCMCTGILRTSICACTRCGKPQIMTNYSIKNLEMQMEYHPTGTVCNYSKMLNTGLWVPRESQMKPIFRHFFPCW